MKRSLFLVLLAGVLLGVASTAQQNPDARDMRVLSHQDLQARSAYHPAIQRQGDRWIAYVGHHGGEQTNPLTGRPESNGTSIVDVTNPRAPRYLAHIPGEKGEGESGGAQMVRVCPGSELPRADRSKAYLLRSFGNSGHEIWDVTNPEQPARVTVLVSGLTNTHKSWWECDTGIAYVVSGDPAWRTRRMTKIYDLSDPASPVFIRDFGLPGHQPGSTGPLPAELHGPISLGPRVNRIYFGYGTSRDGVLQIVDREKLLKGPKEPTEANLLYPQISRLDMPRDGGAHTTLPLLGYDLAEFAKQKAPPPSAPLATDPHDHGGGVVLGIPQAHRDFVALVSESTQNECFEPRQMVRMVDITYETRPMGASTWTVPEASGGFCDRGGRFGAHASHENPTPIYLRRVLFVAYFNAGLRALDIRDPFNPREIAHFIPPVTEKTDRRCVGTGAAQRCKVAVQTNNVDVDERGYIYIVDRANTGMHILELTGAARQVAAFPGS